MLTLIFDIVRFLATDLLIGFVSTKILDIFD